MPVQMKRPSAASNTARVWRVGRSMVGSLSRVLINVIKLMKLSIVFMSFRTQRSGDPESIYETSSAYLCDIGVLMDVASPVSQEIAVRQNMPINHIKRI